MIEDYSIELIQMMENAGRNLAHLARTRFLENDPRSKKVVILAGTGGNGGGALVCARHLHNYGAQVYVFLTKPEEAFPLIPAQQLGILRHMNLPVAQASDISNVAMPALIVDGIIGYGLKGTPRGSAAYLIRWANNQNFPILSLDAPSGIDTTTGEVFEPAIKSTATMTLALPKEGFRAPGVDVYVGELYLADISVPPALYKNPPFFIEVGHLFAENNIVRLI